MAPPKGVKAVNQIDRRGAEPTIQERSFSYALRIMRLHDVLVRGERTSASKMAWQLLRCGTSIGANIQEAQSAESRADFIHKMSIAQKEARESLYWLRLLLAAGYLTEHQAGRLIEETNRIVAIIASIVIATKKRMG